LAVTVGRLPELVPEAEAEALASILAGVAAAFASAAAAATIAIAPFIVMMWNNLYCSSEMLLRPRG